MNRIFAFCLTALLALTLPSCRAPWTPTATPTPTATAEATKKPKATAKPGPKMTPTATPSASPKPTDSPKPTPTAKSSGKPTGTPWTTLRPDQNFDYDVTRPIGNNEKHIHRVAFDIGSCRLLSGKTYVYCFFVDDDKSAWTQKQADLFMAEQVTPALDFLTVQAEKWGVELSFDVQSFCNETADFSLTYQGTVNKDLEKGGSTKDIFEQMARNRGYSSEKAFSYEQDQLHGGVHAGDDTVYLMILNKRGRSYTRNLYTPGEVYYLNDAVPEHSVIFAKDIDTGSKERGSTVAHEILHLFGPEDFYGELRLPLATKYYPYDIMTLNTRNLEKLEIGQATAFMLGWNDDVPEVCYQQAWKDGRDPLG